MANKRAENKVQIGGYIDVATEAGVLEWLKRHSRATKTDFLFEAIVEKLKRENIPLLPEAGNRQRPMRPNVIFDTAPSAMNGANSAKTAASVHDLVESKLSEAEQRAAAKVRSKKIRPKAKVVPPAATPET